MKQHLQDRTAIAPHIRQGDPSITGRRIPVGMPAADPNELEKLARLLAQARLVIARLEKLSPDSVWARRSSGTRGALLKLVEQLEKDIAQGNDLPGAPMVERLEHLTRWGFELLVKSASERFFAGGMIGNHH